MTRSLTAKIPNNEELLDLDSFDLAFCCATGHAHFVDTNDILFKTAASLKLAEDFKAVTLWGPESELVSKVFARAWKEQSGSKLNDIRSAFDVSGDITVNKKKVQSILKKMSKDGEMVWARVGPAVVQALAATVERADGHFEKQIEKRLRKKQLNEVGWAAFVSEATGDHVAAFTKAYPGRVLHPEVTRLVGLTEMDPATRLIDKAELTNRISKINQMPASYFKGVSDVHVGRCWNFTGLQAAQEQEVTRYIWSAKEDRVTCPVCSRLDGKTFDVDAAHGKMKKYLDMAGPDEDPDAISDMMQFPRVKNIDNMSPEKIGEQGWQPPAHGRCFAKGTEVYTSEGWKLFEDLRGDELFMSRREDGQLEWVRAIRKVEYHFRGKMIRLQSRWFDLCVTPDHDQPFERRVDHGKERIREYFLQPVKDMIKFSEWAIPRTGVWNGTGKCNRKFARFMGYYLSEGSTVERWRDSGSKYYMVSIAQSSNLKWKIARYCCVDGVQKVWIGKDKIYLKVTDKLGAFLLRFGKSHEKFVPGVVKNAGREVIQEFLEAYLEGDGSETESHWGEKKLSSSRRIISTSSTRMAGDIGELILKVGGYPSFVLSRCTGEEMVCPRTGKKYKINHDQLTIRWNTTKFASSDHTSVERVDYNGMVRDVELERNHVLWVRYNGKTCFSGNCRCDIQLLWKKKK